MFTNEFGQTIKADWVSLSIRVEDLSAFGTTIVRSIVRNSDVSLKVETLESEETYLHASLTGVVAEEDAEKLRESLGIDIRLFDGEYDANDSSALVARILQLIFGNTVTYNFDVDGDVVIQMDFDGYIRRTHGL